MGKTLAVPYGDVLAVPPQTVLGNPDEVEGPTQALGAQAARGLLDVYSTDEVDEAIGSGSQGPTGPTGPAGSTGPTGAQGPTGSTGLTGSQGPTGAQGPAGAQDGEDGAQGAQGAIGAQGFVGAQGAQGPTGTVGGLIPYVTKTGAYTLTNSDEIVECTSGTFDLTLPTAVGIAGKRFHIDNSGTGVITLLTTSAQTIHGLASGVLTVLQNETYTIVSNGSNWRIM